VNESVVKQMTQVTAMSQQHSSSNPSSIWLGRSVGDGNRYRLDEQLGGGGMGEVFLAMDTRLGKPVALKLLKESLAIAEDTTLRERFEKECSICAALKSPHIVQVTDYGVTSEGYPFFVMEYLQGQTLGDVMAAEQRLSVDRACNIMSQVCDGLRLAHTGVTFWDTKTGMTEQIKVIHRDLKPANIFLVPTALGELAKVIDFGIAKIHFLQNEYTSTTGMFLGTCHYAPPEQFNVMGEVDERADIYSLGMMLYEMLSGVDPFGFDFKNNRVSNDNWLTAHARRMPFPLRSQPGSENLPSSLEDIVRRCLEKKPGDRFASVSELSDALRSVNAGMPIRFSPVSATEETIVRTKSSATMTATKTTTATAASRPWLYFGGALLLGAIVLYSVPRFFPSVVPPGIISSNKNPFSLNTHQISLLKTLAENPQKSQAIAAAILSPDQRTLVSAGEDRDPFNPQLFPVKIWDLTTGEVPNTLNDGHTAPILTLSLSADGTLLASGSADNTIKIWDLPTGKLLQTLKGHTAPVTSVAISRDGKTVISGSEDSTIKIWDVPTAVLRHTLTEHTDKVYAVALSPDGKAIASGSQDFTVKLWNAETGELTRTLSQPAGHRNAVSAVAISPDGKQVASGSWEKNVKVWDLQTGKILRTFEGHRDKVTTVTFINDQTVASGSLDKSIRIWDTQSEKFQEIQNAHTAPVLSLTARPADQQLVSASQDKTIKIWQWTKGGG
jgi:eukaryotic-like serine/threonine-protein kinase